MIRIIHLDSSVIFNPIIQIGHSTERIGSSISTSAMGVHKYLKMFILHQSKDAAAYLIQLTSLK